MRDSLKVLFRSNQQSDCLCPTTYLLRQQAFTKVAEVGIVHCQIRRLRSWSAESALTLVVRVQEIREFSIRARTIAIDIAPPAIAALITLDARRSTKLFEGIQLQRKTLSRNGSKGVFMKYSVGKNGKNHASDVRIVQELLNRFINAGKLTVDPLVVDGDCGKLTKAAIKWFQVLFLGHKAPDGRVDPGGPTLAALCGPVTQPMKGDPNDSLIQSVVSTLKTSMLNHVYFSMGALQIRSGDYHMLADRFANRRLMAFHSPGKGDSAEYFHKNSGDLGGYMLLGFPSAVTAFQQSVIVHEATHALCDARGVDMLSEDVEALSHLAQSMYYYLLGGREFPVSLESTKNVLRHCITIVDQMKSTGVRNVISSDRLELYRLVRLLPSVRPSWGFKFDGL